MIYSGIGFDESPNSENGEERPQKPIKRGIAPASFGKYPYGVDIKDLKKVSTWRSVVPGVATQVSAAALTAGTALLLEHGMLLSGTGAALASACVLGFTYRGLECLVHGGSHYDVHENPEINDWLCDRLMAWPVFQTVAAFRLPHLDSHHSDFAGQMDPCRIRMAQHQDVRNGGLPTLRETLRGLPREAKEFYGNVGTSPLTVLKGLSWHIAVIIAPLAMITGSLSYVALAWLLIHALTFFGSLVAVRAVAEAGEHDYAQLGSAPYTLVERTFDKTGVLNTLFHLYGDKWHVEHHLFPRVPQYRLSEVNKRLLAKGYGAHIRHRTTVLGQPAFFQDRPNAAHPVEERPNNTNRMAN